MVPPAVGVAPARVAVSWIVPPATVVGVAAVVSVGVAFGPIFATNAVTNAFAVVLKAPAVVGKFVEKVVPVT